MARPTTTNVFRTMLPDINGESFSPAPVGGEVVFNYPYSLDPAWTPSEIYVLAWVQEMDSLKVFNSGTRFDLKAAITENNGSATATAQGGEQPYSYLWSTGATTSTVSGLPAGTHTVTITDNTGAWFMESVTVSSSVGIEPQRLDRLVTVYPNPTRSRLFVDLNGVEFREGKLRLTDLTGKQVAPVQTLRSGQAEIFP